MITFTDLRISLSRRIKALCVVLLAGVLLFSLQQLNGRTKRIRVGFSEFAPYVTATAEGRPSGLAVEMLRKAADAAQVSLEWIPVSGDLDAALKSAKIDVYPLLTLTAARRQAFHTSQPWWENEIALTSLESRPLRSAQQTSGKHIGIRGMPVVANLARALFPSAHFVIIPRIEELMSALCRGEVEGIFLDMRLLESQLLKGTFHCPGQALHIASLPNGNLSLGTVARPNVSATVDRLYQKLAEFSADGTLSETASRWSLYNPFESRHLKDALESQHRAAMMRYGLAAMILILVLVSIQTQRIRMTHAVAQRARLLAEESQQRFDAFMRYMPALAFIKDAEGRMAFINDSFCALFQTTREQTLGRSDRELWPADIGDRFRQADLRILKAKRPEEVLETVIVPSGEQRSFLSYKFPFLNGAGEQLLGGVAIDITERLRAEEALKLSQFSIDCSQDTMLWIDNRGHIFNANRAAFRNLGYKPDELIGLHISAIDPSIDHEGFLQSRVRLKRAGSLTTEANYRQKNGGTYPVEITQNFLDFQGQEYSCCMSRDITDRKLSELELSRQALHDSLTGLPNRRFLEARLSQAIEQAQLEQSAVGVIYLDLDGFKLVNDTLGHSIGDQLLRQVAGRLKESLRDCDMLFRMGGDEFTLVLTDLPNRAGISVVAHQLLANLHESFSVEGNDLSITASIGVSMFPEDGKDNGALLRNADAAMYESKREGKNRIQFFTAEMGKATRERLELENHLRRAMERREFSLHFQPEICMKTGRVVRHEALLRWVHPALGHIPPSKFVPIAEETTLIVSIGTWVLEEACRRAKEWQDEDEGVGVAVNVSLVQFRRPDFVETVTTALKKTGLPPYLLDLELTESVVMRDVEETVKKVSQLRAVGLSVSIDDFGTGYSSLSYLQQLPINSLKIDRSFIQDIAFNANAVSLTGALVSMAHSLGMSVVVEGIETTGQLTAIQKLGCDVGQGYFLGEPSPMPMVLRQQVAAA